MFAIDHAATALLLKRRFPKQPMVPLLLSVQLMELLWVTFNLLGIERTTTEPVVRSVADIHLSYIPWSHSVASSLALAVVVWLLGLAFRRPALGLAMALGVLSHLVLDLLTHAPDIALAPVGNPIRIGLGLYSAFPVLAFVLELLYGIFCWRVFGGGKSLLAVIVVFNVANLSLLSPGIPGPESLLAGQPTAIVLVILAQILVTLVLVGYYASFDKRVRHLS
jgi:hypothetical protein